jgi:hypothetical protein
MEFHSLFGHCIVPLLDALDGQITKLAYECVTEDLSSPTANSRVFDSIVYVADDAYALRVCDDNLLSS